MTSKTRPPRKPAAFRLDPQPQRPGKNAKSPASPQSLKGNARIKAETVEYTPFPEDSMAGGTAASDAPAAPVPAAGGSKAKTRWGLIFVSALGALLSLGIGLAVTGIIEQLFARHPWLGWAGLGLSAIAGLAAIVLAGRELAALMRQRRISHISARADAALRNRDAALARTAQDELISLYRRRDELAWASGRLREHDEDILDAPDRLALTERELMAPLDKEARALIAAAARRVSILTALSPSALLDISFVAAANLRLMRALAELYGGRPGLLGLLRLARMVLTHLTLTGGLALGDDMLQQLLGHSLASRISARLGEGVLNGAMTARIGLAAMQVCRPMPFRALQPPGLKGMVGALISSPTSKMTSPEG